MIFITSMALGLTAGFSRSAFTIAGVAVLIVAMFALATVLSPGPLVLSNLLIAGAGYNIGLIELVVGLLMLEQRRSKIS